MSTCLLQALSPLVCGVVLTCSCPGERLSLPPQRCFPTPVAGGFEEVCGGDGERSAVWRVKRRNRSLGIGTSNHISISGVIGGHGSPPHALPGPVPSAAVRRRVGGPPVPGVGPRRAGCSGGACGGLVLLRPPAGFHDGVDDWRRTGIGWRSV